MEKAIKKLLTLMLGLCFLVGSAGIFAQVKRDPPQKESKKVEKQKVGSPNKVNTAAHGKSADDWKANPKAATLNKTSAAAHGKSADDWEAKQKVASPNKASAPVHGKSADDWKANPKAASPRQ